MHGNSCYAATDAFSCFQVAMSRSHSNLIDLAPPCSHLSTLLLLSPYWLGVEGVSALPSGSGLAFGVAEAVVCPAFAAGLGLLAQ